MAQHPLLMAAARGLSLWEILKMTDEQAFACMAEARWGSKTHQTCSHCGVIDEHRFTPAQKRWRCRHCYKAFSVTSGTKLHAAKLPLQLMMGAFALFANAVKGISALQMSRDLNVQYKTAFVLLHKIREMLDEQEDTGLMGPEVELDVGWVCTAVRPENRKEDRPDRRLAENQNPNKCAVVVLRERSVVPGAGATRTRTFIIESENAADVLAILIANVQPGATIFTDEAPAYATLGARWNHQVVSHSVEYSTKDGVNQNQAESFISRMRRLVMGQIHQLTRKYLDVYVNEIAMREDRRRKSNKSTYEMLLTGVLKAKRSRDWSKYWQGNHRTHDSVRRYA